ncbi:MAG: hypothetical protein CMM58_08875 [Rhodospirillaceae bacterium]|nr:hypothetical protein [Rhodospirillaceae bacterium]|tara:strand:+ start:2649 stop:3908 length:1260 start_codon:yes stop_codon:yes gene_type:complete
MIEKLDQPIVINEEETKKIFSGDNMADLINLISPHVAPSKKTLIYILPASGRFAHMAMEPWALHNIYGDIFDQILIIIPDRSMLQYGDAIYKLASTVVKFVETTNPHIIGLGHFDVSNVEAGSLFFLFQSPEQLLKDLVRHQLKGNPIKYMKLSPDLRKQRDNFFSELAITDDDRIITVHVREGTYLSSLDYHSFRYMTLKNYKPAVDYLLNQGYWVVRLGDKTSTSFDIDNPKFLDLPNYKDYEDFMDLAVISRAYFALSCPSGPEASARALGTPSLLLNNIFNTMHTNNEYDLMQPKTIIDIQNKNRPLSYKEILSKGVINYSLAKEFETAGLKVEENTPSEILSAVEEMLSRLEGTFIEDAKINCAFSEINKRHAKQTKDKAFGYLLPATKICHNYCKKHPEFINIKYNQRDNELN